MDQGILKVNRITFSNFAVWTYDEWTMFTLGSAQVPKVMPSQVKLDDT